MSSDDFNVEAAEKEIEENPCNIKVLCDLGQYYAHKAEYSSALRYYEKIVRINEDNARAWSALGHCSLLKQDYSRCISSYQHSLLNKDECLDVQLWYGISCLYFSLEDWKNAETVLQAILKMESDLVVKFDIFFKLGVISAKEQEMGTCNCLPRKGPRLPNPPVQQEGRDSDPIGGGQCRNR